MGLSLPVATMRALHIITADDATRPNVITWSIICRMRIL
jgi:hypothetical protein